MSEGLRLLLSAAAVYALVIMTVVVVSHAVTGFYSWGWIQNVTVLLLGWQALLWLWIAHRASLGRTPHRFHIYDRACLTCRFGDVSARLWWNAKKLFRRAG